VRISKKGFNNGLVSRRVQCLVSLTKLMRELLRGETRMEGSIVLDERPATAS
jgi:hypothetical protein